MPLPVFVSSEAEREQLLQINPVARIRAIAEKAELRLVGVGQIDQGAQLFVDGFISREELLELMRLGAVGELIGWAFDAQSRIIEGGTNRRLTSVPHRVAADPPTVGAALGPAKVLAIRAALAGLVLTCRITHRITATAL